MVIVIVAVAVWPVVTLPNARLPETPMIRVSAGAVDTRAVAAAPVLLGMATGVSAET